MNDKLNMVLDPPKWHRPDLEDARLNVRRRGPLTARDYTIIELLLDWALANLNVDSLPAHGFGSLHHSPEDVDKGNRR